MTCEECSKAHDEERYCPVRIGNKAIGWGIIIMKGCTPHLKLALDRINAGVIEEIEKE